MVGCVGGGRGAVVGFGRGWFVEDLLLEIPCAEEVATHPSNRREEAVLSMDV